MPLAAESLPRHPDGATVNKLDPGTVSYRRISKWRDRYCGNCPLFLAVPDEDFDDLEEFGGGDHPNGDGKGPVHRCALVGGGIARGGYCEAWGMEQRPPETEKGIRGAFRRGMLGT